MSEERPENLVQLVDKLIERNEELQQKLRKQPNDNENFDQEKEELEEALDEKEEQVAKLKDIVRKKRAKVQLLEYKIGNRDDSIEKKDEQIKELQESQKESEDDSEEEQESEEEYEYSDEVKEIAKEVLKYIPDDDHKGWQATAKSRGHSYNKAQRASNWAKEEGFIEVTSGVGATRTEEGLDYLYEEGVLKDNSNNESEYDYYVRGLYGKQPNIDELSPKEREQFQEYYLKEEGTGKSVTKTLNELYTPPKSNRNKNSKKQLVRKAYKNNSNVGTQPSLGDSKQKIYYLKSE